MLVNTTPLLEKFIRAKNASNAGLFVSCFTEDAVVQDDGQEMRGHEAIGAWFEGASRRYKLTLTPIEITEDGGETVLRASVAGDFDGSPVEFTYRLTVEHGKFSALNILT